MRAADVLARCDAIACEDTRVTAKLLRHLGISRPLWRYDDHSGAEARARLLDSMRDKAVVLVSDAGTPLVSDPGYKLVREAREAGIPVTSLPGPSAPVMALTLSGLPSDRFLFAGFLPSKDKARREVLDELGGVRATLVFFETAPRLTKSLQAIAEALPGREVAVARELTKMFETIHQAPLGEMGAWLEADVNRQRGEFVLIVSGASAKQPESGLGEAALRVLLEELAPAQAARLAAKLSGVPRGSLYDLAVKLRADTERDG